jgi:hypothetical protein
MARNDKGRLAVLAGLWDEHHGLVIARLFSGVPHLHLLGVCHRTIRLETSPKKNMNKIASRYSGNQFEKFHQTPPGLVFRN